MGCVPTKKLKASAKGYRGAGADGVLQQFEENYESVWAPKVKNMSDSDRQTMVTKMNGIFMGLGDDLCGDKAMYSVTKGGLSPDQTKQFADALCPAYYDPDA